MLWLVVTTDVSNLTAAGLLQSQCNNTHDFQWLRKVQKHNNKSRFIQLKCSSALTHILLKHNCDVAYKTFRRQTDKVYFIFYWLRTLHIRFLSYRINENTKQVFSLLPELETSKIKYQINPILTCAEKFLTLSSTSRFSRS